MNEDLPSREVIPLSEQIRAVEREIDMRRNVYPRRVAERKMSQAKADAEIRNMQAVLLTLRAIAEPS